MKIIFLLLFLVSCGKESATSSSQEVSFSIEPELSTYVERFKHEADMYGKNVEITNLIAEFKSLDYLGPDKIGVCYYPTDGKGTPIIYIDPVYWAKGTKSPHNNNDYSNNPTFLEAAREYVIFHELGHCVLGYSHRDDKMNLTKQTSIMNTYALSPSFYLGVTNKTPSWNCLPNNNYACLMTELFYPNQYDYQSILLGLIPKVLETDSEELYITESYNEEETHPDEVIYYDPEEFNEIRAY